MAGGGDPVLSLNEETTQSSFPSLCVHPPLPSRGTSPGGYPLELILCSIAGCGWQMPDLFWEPGPVHLPDILEGMCGQPPSSIIGRGQPSIHAHNARHDDKASLAVIRSHPALGILCFFFFLRWSPNVVTLPPGVLHVVGRHRVEREEAREREREGRERPEAFPPPRAHRNPQGIHNCGRLVVAQPWLVIVSRPVNPPS